MEAAISTHTTSARKLSVPGISLPHLVSVFLRSTITKVEFCDVLRHHALRTHQRGDVGDTIQQHVSERGPSQ